MVPIKESPQAAAVASQSGQRIGHVYQKAMFREYTDITFTQQSPRPEVRFIAYYLIVCRDADVVQRSVVGPSWSYHSCRGWRHCHSGIQ